MRLDVFMRADCARDSIKFYVEELGLFKVDTDYGMDAFLLRATQNPDLCLQLTSWHSVADQAPRFALSVANCDAELKRLAAVTFSSGGGLVANVSGVATVFEWPGGKSIRLQDPSGNRFLLFEDYISTT